MFSRSAMIVPTITRARTTAEAIRGLGWVGAVHGHAIAVALIVVLVIVRPF